MRRISPLRTYQTVPFVSRSVVIRRPTASTLPTASPVSTTSPTPYWSSSIMNTPDRKSFTRFWAPNPIATPTMPADARIGPRFTPSSPRIIMNASPNTMNETIDLNTEPMVCARCARRSESSWPSACGARSRSGRSTVGILPPVALVSRSIRRRQIARTTSAPMMISRIVIGFAMSQCDEAASHSLWVQL